MVIYAAPRFWQMSALDSHTQSNNLVSESFFVKANRIARRHTCYTYQTHPTLGYGFSEPEEILGFEFSKELNRVTLDRNPIDPREGLRIAATAVKDATVDGKWPLSNIGISDDDLSQLYIYIESDLKRIGKKLNPDNKPIISDYAHIARFCWLANMQWLAFGV